MPASEDSFTSTGSEDDESEIIGMRSSIERSSVDAGLMFVLDGATLNEKMGVSGMSITAHTNCEYIQLVGIWVQSLVLQVIMLTGLWNEVQKNRNSDPEDFQFNAMTVLRVVALALHFVNCFGEMPFSLNLFLRINQFFDTTKELCLGGPIFITDALLVPTVQLFLGGLFICTSKEAVDVLLNSCAVAFISQIDNWILGLNFSMIDLAGDELHLSTVHIPYNKRFCQVMQYSVCQIPLVPVVFSVGVAYWATSLGLTMPLPVEA